VEENKTLKTFKFNKRMVRFMGFDDEASLRGYASTHCYLNEADQMTRSAFDQVAPRTTGRIFLDFNPDDEDIWINTHLEQRRALDKKDVTVIVSSYKDNPFLTTAQIEEIEYRKDNDPQWWAAFGEGKYASKRGRIFTFDILPEVPEGAPFKGYGLDFGYTNSKTALVKCWENETDIWLQGLLYESGLQNHDIVAHFKNLIPNRRDYIVADCEEPKAIDFIASYGFNIHKSVKGPDSIENGISYMKGKKLHLISGDDNLRSNFRNYKWKEDRNGTPLNEPLKIDDHYCDAARYISTFKLGAPKTERDFFN
jgi:phage terminase large subunit